ncbi:concanavalin A-like lectin/glucanase domain-containing protein [Lipomyces kononenkoae]|uniref:Concanavalin A-like lectin/glucanase domain-containing protein n=1 Tax=Lipomyces kononenkoae TaxID=34357 RepID=A0ACC3SU99_LIPKO
MGSGTMTILSSESKSPADGITTQDSQNNNDDASHAPANSSTPAAPTSASNSEAVDPAPTPSNDHGEHLIIQEPARPTINTSNLHGRPTQLGAAKSLSSSISAASLQGLASGSRFLRRTDAKGGVEPATVNPASPTYRTGTEPSSPLPLTIGGMMESDPAFQDFKSFAFTNIGPDSTWTGFNPGTNLPPSPNIVPLDATMSPSSSRPPFGANITAPPRSRAGLLNSIPDVPPTPLPPPHSLQSAGRAVSTASMQRRPSVFFQRPSTASLRSRLPSRGGLISVGNNEQAGRIHTRRHFVSRRLPLGYSAEKPWLTGQAKAEKVLSWIIVISFIIGLAIIGILTWVGTTQIQNYNYCTVLDENFAAGSLNTTIWTHDVQVGGFGNGEFEWATSSSNNSFVRDGKLYIMPTFTADVIGQDNMMNGYTVNLTAAGTCTSTADSDCVISSNQTLGDMIPPIMSARLLTRNFAKIRYGKVEVTAKLPQGDWLWPAIWMMPTDSVYGPWPASGEIDICESRGNDHTYPPGGVNVMSSTLHWGPTMALDRYYKTHVALALTHSTFADGFHTFGLEWSEKYIMTYLDGRLRQVVYHKFGTPFWPWGKFPNTYDNGTTVSNPWPANDVQAPFDQDFYLILNVAVGGTNGWFPDNQANKPWNNDDRQTAMNSFWNLRSQWEPTWGDENSRAMIVDSVKIYTMC